MGDVDVIQDDVDYTSMKEDDDNVHLYACMLDATEFNKAVDEKLQRDKRTTHATDRTKPKLRTYLSKHVPKIAKALNFTVVTDFQTDHLLTVKHKDPKVIFVYFGAMNKELIHVACWLRIERNADNKIDENHNPNIFFWVLHMSYAQELQALGSSAEGVVMADLKKCLTLTESIEYHERV